MLLLAQRANPEVKLVLAAERFQSGGPLTGLYIVVAVLGLVLQSRSTDPRLGGAYRLQVLLVRQKHTHCGFKDEKHTSPAFGSVNDCSATPDLVCFINPHTSAEGSCL